MSEQNEMKISEIYQLEKSQFELNFVDIDIDRDLPLFVDPYFIGTRNDRWSIDAHSSIRSFFQTLLNHIKANRLKEARDLFLHLEEPNETCLGISSNAPQGRGVGTSDSDKIFESLLQSNAAQSGLLEELEDCQIFVDGFGPDKLSDMTTNIIRKHLNQYTASQCNLHGISLTPGVQSGYYWDRTTLSWKNEFTDSLVINGRKYLLVPKTAVCFKTSYTPKHFHQHFVLTYLRNEHMRLRTHLLQFRVSKRTGQILREFVTKKSVKETESPGDKQNLRDFTNKHFDIFSNFKQQMRNNPPDSVEASAFDLTIELKNVALHLTAKLKSVSPGTESATDFHRTVSSILELLMYPNLTCPLSEVKIDNGRKRIDITLDNSSKSGVFFELNQAFETPCPYILAECKNYSSDPANNELDQLAGRFSPQRGKVGLLVCRNFSNEELFVERCKDTYKAHRGLIIPLSDRDLISGLNFLASGTGESIEEILRKRRRTIQLG